MQVIIGARGLTVSRADGDAAVHGLDTLARRLSRAGATNAVVANAVSHRKDGGVGLVEPRG